ncbi:hypothetical protein SLE2022_167390 [Rubroshorea leprosula]
MRSSLLESRSQRRSTEEALLLQLQFVKLLLAVHLDDERHRQDEKRRSSNPRCSSRAPQQLLRDHLRVGRCSSGSDGYRRLGNGAGQPGDETVIGTGAERGAVFGYVRRHLEAARIPWDQ